MSREQMLEAEFRELKNHVQSMLQTARGFFFYRVAIDPDVPSKVRVIMVSPSIRDVAGIEDPDNFESWFVHLHPDDIPRIRAANDLSLRSGVAFDEVSRWFHPLKQEWIWVRTISQPVTDARGVITHFNGLCLDITRQQQSEAKLAESESRFRLLIEGAPDAIFVQTEGRFRYLNPAMCRLLGAESSSPFLGIDIFTRIAPEYHAVVRERIRQQMTSGQPSPPMERVYLRVDGVRIPVETTAVRIMFENREAHLVFVRDMAERHRHEAESRQRREELEQINRELRASQRQLQRLSEQLLSAQEEERRRVAVELHDGIGQYLCGLKFNLDGLEDQMASKGATPDETRRIHALSDVVAHAVDDIRRMVSALRPSILDSNSLDKAVVWLCEQFNGNGRIELKTDLQPVDGAIDETTRIAIFRVIQEALSNAIRHSGATRIRIRLRRAAGGGVAMSVEDNGKGYNPETKAGTGVGLGSMRDRAHVSGGTLQVTTTPGKGTKVAGCWPGR